MRRQGTNIRRIDNDENHTHAWLVRVQRMSHLAVKMFSDSVHGGRRASLAAAQAWRQEQACEDAQTLYDQGIWRRSIKRRNNRSGIVGVSRMVRSDSGVANWVASWTDEEGRNRSRKFSTRVHGERGAKQMAIEERERQSRRMAAIRAGLSLSAVE